MLTDRAHPAKELCGGGLLAKAQAVSLETFLRRTSRRKRRFRRDRHRRSRSSDPPGGYIVTNIGSALDLLHQPAGGHPPRPRCARCVPLADHADVGAEEGPVGGICGSASPPSGSGSFQVFLGEGYSGDWSQSPFIVVMACLSIGLVLRDPPRCSSPTIPSSIYARPGIARCRRQHPPPSYGMALTAPPSILIFSATVLHLTAQRSASSCSRARSARRSRCRISAPACTMDPRLQLTIGAAIRWPVMMLGRSRPRPARGALSGRCSSSASAPSYVRAAGVYSPSIPKKETSPHRPRSTPRVARWFVGALRSPRSGKPPTSHRSASSSTRP